MITSAGEGGGRQPLSDVRGKENVGWKQSLLP